MNKAVKSWNNSVQKINSVSESPDKIEIEGQKIQVEEIDEMSERKSPHTEAILDNSAVKADPNTEKSKEVIQLSKSHFNNVVRFIQRSSIDRVHAVRTSTHRNMKRLKLKRNLSKAVKGIPKGSDQADGGTLKTWMEKITDKDKKAIKQLIVLDATCCARG